MKIAAVTRLLFACLVILPLQSHAQTSIGSSTGFAVGPLSLSLQGRPGATVRSEFTVVSTGGERATRYVIERFDLNQTPEGATITALRGTGARSCADWITMDSALALGPGERRVVQLTIAVPANAQGAYYALVSVRYLPSQAGGNMTLSVQAATVVRVELQIPGPAPLHVDVRNLKVESATRGSNPVVTFDAVNTGVWPATIEGDVLLYSETATFPIRVPVPFPATGQAYRIYPGMTVKLLCPMAQSLPAGQYRVLSRLMMNDRWPTRGEFSVTVGAGAGGGKWSGALQAKYENDLALVIEPDFVELSMPPGASRVVPVRIQNRDTRDANVVLSVTGFRMESDGGFTFPNQTSTDSEWVSLETSSITVASGRTQTVRASVNIPSDLDAYATIVRAVRIQATAPTVEEGWTRGFEDAVVIVAAGPKASQPVLELKTPQLIRPDPDRNPTAALVQLKNTGAKAGRIQGEIVLERASGQKVVTMDIGSETSEVVLPGKERLFRLPIPPLDKDAFRVRASVSVVGETKPAQTAQVTFTSETAIPAGL